MLSVSFLLRYLLGLIILTEMSVSMKPATFNRKSYARPRVIEGFSDVNNKYPYVVTLEVETHVPQLPFFRVCTGSMISSQFVITAVHCLLVDVQLIRCGNMTLPVNESTCLSKIVKEFRHPSYWQRRLQNDIALLQIEKLEMSSYGRLNFADYKTLFGRAVQYAGYGVTTYSMQTLLEAPKRLKIPLQIGEGVIFNDEYKPFTYPMLLMSSKCSNRQQHPYSGDSGGPMFVENKIVGVCCSAGKHMAKGIKKHPPFATYTPVSPYVDWIKQIIKNHAIK